MRCTLCGSENPEEYRFCGSCGSPLGRPISPPAPAPRTVPLGSDSADYVVPVDSPLYDSVESSNSARSSDWDESFDWVESDEERAAGNKRVVLIGGLLGMAGITTACLGCLVVVFLLNFSPWSAAPATPPTVQANQIDEGTPTDVPTPLPGKWTLTVSKTERAKALALANGDNRPAKGTWVIVYATLKNNTSQPVMLAEDDVQLVADGGTAYKPSTGFYAKSFANEKKVAALGTSFAAGASTPMAILFDIDAKAANLTLKIRPTNETITLP